MGPTSRSSALASSLVESKAKSAKSLLMGAEVMRQHGACIVCVGTPPGQTPGMSDLIHVALKLKNAGRWRLRCVEFRREPFAALTPAQRLDPLFSTNRTLPPLLARSLTHTHTHTHVYIHSRYK